MGVFFAFRVKLTLPDEIFTVVQWKMPSGGVVITVL